ncbi:LppP/LprE family lipoprotein [Mycolicibacterium goodii]|uniref:LppP/LprE family lipoprotein n=1 Tax=Mycolicibacterium goodii TaxID=134601 RepID=UPI0009F98C56|nr:LppP/LprE family lipoprotein [Mycolicibacterium goodii]MBU8817551.1 LppP/LprE family lipoprotein [Mycolicibacterium goodii]
MSEVDVAVAGLERLREDLEWRVSEAGGPTVAGVSWAHAIVPEGTVSTPDHVLLFCDGRLVGTATAEPRPYTRVVAASGDTVTVEYRWIVGDEPLAAPAGSAKVRYQVTADGVTPLDPVPWPEELS